MEKLDVSISHQGSLVKISPNVKRAVFPHRYGSGDRKAITAFTKRSRKNLLERFSILEQGSIKNASLITLTYISNNVDAHLAKRHLDTFYKRLARLNSDWFACWRMEPQKRGAWHFHLMVFNPPYIHKEWVAQIWGEITGEFDRMVDSEGDEHLIPPFTRIERIRGVKRTWYYVSKYVAKVDDNGFNIGSNLTAPGRFWGWVKRKNIVYAPELRATIETTWAEYRRFTWDLARVAEHTAQTHITHTRKMFWFTDLFTPISMYFNIKSGSLAFF